jgi:hypothetical protein
LPRGATHTVKALGRGVDDLVADLGQCLAAPREPGGLRKAGTLEHAEAVAKSSTQPAQRVVAQLGVEDTVTRLAVDHPRMPMHPVPRIRSGLQQIDPAERPAN